MRKLHKVKILLHGHLRESHLKRQTYQASFPRSTGANSIPCGELCSSIGALVFTKRETPLSRGKDAVCGRLVCTLDGARTGCSCISATLPLDKLIGAGREREDDDDGPHLTPRPRGSDVDSRPMTDRVTAALNKHPDTYGWKERHASTRLVHASVPSKHVSKVGIVFGIMYDTL